jgi:hypothetical protein
MCGNNRWGDGIVWSSGNCLVCLVCAGVSVVVLGVVLHVSWIDNLVVVVADPGVDSRILVIHVLEMLTGAAHIFRLPALVSLRSHLRGVAPYLLAEKAVGGIQCQATVLWRKL